LGDYKKIEFEEYHYKTLTVAQNMRLASKNSNFYKQYGFEGAPSDINDKDRIYLDDI
jgi:hypothetical protein